VWTGASLIHVNEVRGLRGVQGSDRTSGVKYVRAKIISVLGVVAGLSLSTLAIATPERAVSATGSAVPAIVASLVSDIVPKANAAHLKGEMKQKQPKKPKRLFTRPNVVHSPEINAQSGGQAIALIIGAMLLGFERVRRTARN